MNKKFLIFFLIPTAFYAQVKVDVNWNVKHTVGGVSTFERSKFMTIHANQTEAEWDGDNQIADLRDDFLNGYDVYLGRETGLITYTLNTVAQDPLRPGFASPSDISAKGANHINNFKAKPALKQYESRKNLILCGQLYPFWTGTDSKPTGKGWYLANGTATGEYMGKFIKAFNGGEGPNYPAFVEIVNEPDWDLLGGINESSNSIKEIADFHVTVASAIRAEVPNAKIAGYTNAFPNYEVNNFQKWTNRDKMFCDIAGTSMDYWSVHLYDFPTIGGKRQMRSGSYMEATFDMMDQYSYISLGSVKPYIISEYGAQTHDYNNQQWSSYRDWLNIKSFNSMLMTFLERPNTIVSAIPFAVVKAEWGYNTTTGIPYGSRLMRKENEPESYTGQWVYTDFVKFWQQWKNVKGTRVEIKSDDPDILVKAYVDGDKGYVIINNLEQVSKTINLNLFDNKNENITQIVKRYLTVSASLMTDLQETTITNPITSLTLEPETNVVLEYRFANSLTLDKVIEETKYYSDTYLKPVVANTALSYTVNGIIKSASGSAVLRLGIGRDHGKSLTPIVKVNNTTITLPSDFRGDLQTQRTSFFGVLEIPVPYDVLLENNVVTVQFPDSGGNVSSLGFQVYNEGTHLSTKEFQYDNSVRITPNPTKDSLAVISIDENLLNSVAYIYSIQGSIVHKEKLNQLNTNVKLNSLSKGIYIVVIQKDNKKLARTKLIVN
ncbi:T9SS type A sorting domain-containing protein [Flavobacterium saccharophilum]|uniref:Agarase n=1 Tax=Flavobacterium saccharophilum TaxID=29534 RepID=A0A1M7JJ65_9FLAO|nr:T9SS type A sorting domain-containing protein [Flavobacterium saccharophilum]SHM53028.1 agarase [Flavobacterium saccharophilum]